MEKALSIRCSGNPQDCGRGRRVARKQANQVWTNSCSQHGRECWRRESATDLAEAVMLLEELERVRVAVRGVCHGGGLGKLPS
jgi:hypothetical protein